MINKLHLRQLYSEYGFEEKNSRHPNILVFTIKAGYYHNADIIPIENASPENVKDVFTQFQNAGYASVVREYDDVEKIEKQLFEGFFTVRSTIDRLNREYCKYTKSIVSVYSDLAEYSYIHSNYYLNGKKGEKSIISEISEKLDQQKPTLFLIEAAAGFGKTCSAYEVLNHIINNTQDKVPLFTELSRNRQAKIFRYILLDEIDNSFPLLSSNLVRSQIIKGKVPLILDGFDELLRRTEDKTGFENTEPMLETIGELLSGKAKIILTTRRTAIFDGDEFHSWMDEHESDFDIVRIRIEEPTVTHWLPHERISKLKQKNFPIEKLSNPVLLSYLRSIADQEFDSAIMSAERLVERYFTSMLEREQQRQDLKLSTSQQNTILKSIAKDMLEYNYTAANRDYLYSVLHEKHLSLFEESRKNYPIDQRPTIEELINKIVSHALFDRSSQQTDQGIGFVNEFVQGTYCADVILSTSDYEWDGDARFIEPSILAYLTRSDIRKYSLWLSLKFNLEFLSATENINFTCLLLHDPSLELIGQTIENIEINLADFSNCTFDAVTFINCVFKSCTFNWEKFKDCTVINCEFYSCNGTGNYENIQLFNCYSDPEELVASFDRNVIEESNAGQLFNDIEISILEKFWPIGRPTFHKHRPLAAIVAHSNRDKYMENMNAVNSLKRKGILVVPDKTSFLAIATEKTAIIKEALGRQS